MNETPRTVWHFQLDPSPEWQVVEVPEGAKLLHYQGGSRGYGRFWAEVNPEAEPEMRKVGAFGTGWIIPEGGTYICTDVGPTGYVWHLYDGGRAPESEEGGENG